MAGDSMSSGGPPRLVLASSSPRRAEVLRTLGLDFRVEPPELDEEILSGEPPSDTVERLARRKAATAARPDALALGADTLVALDGEVLGKPPDRAGTEAMLRSLSGRTHRVHTGVAVASPERTESGVRTTRVRFRALTADEISEYAATDEPADKAGAYGIQGMGASLVEAIEGDYFAVMGLPVSLTLELLERFGWRYAFGRLAPVDPGAQADLP